MKCSLLGAILLGFGLAAASFAAETDQFSLRAVPIRDAKEILNNRVNESIAEAVAEWDQSRDDFEFAQSVRWKVEGILRYRRLSAWSLEQPEVQSVPTKEISIYKGVPIKVSTIGPFGVMAPTININGSRLGVDKLSHVFSIGWQYFKYFRKYGEEGAVIRGGGSERGFLGWYTTGVYSNADIVANYEGHIFYRSLSEDGIMGMPSIIRWEGARPVIQRNFDFAHHVNPYWDEAINTSHYRRGVAAYILPRLMKFCAEYFANSDLWSIDPDLDQKLERRYKILALWGHTQYRLENVCSGNFGGGQGDGRQSSDIIDATSGD